MQRLLLFVAACAAFSLPSAAQGTFAGVTVSRVPLVSATQGQDVQLTPDADLSPFPSFIDYPSESSESTVMLGIQGGQRPVGTGIGWRGGLETSILTSALSDSGPSMDVTTLELGGEFVVRLTPLFGVGVGASLLGGFASGEIGTVGSRDGDIFLISPDDGERYETGSTIEAIALGLGADATIDLHAGPVSLGVGYRLASPVDNWEYTVRDPEDATERRSSSLPGAGFAANPPVYDLDGLRLRLGVSIPLGARPARVPRPQSRPVGPAPLPQPDEPAPLPQPDDSAPLPQPDDVVDPLADVPPPGRARVRWVQSRLNDRGYACGTPDGLAGRNTRRCIDAFRSDNGLPETGEITEELLRLLNAPR